jgi:hypothetical protein
VSPSGKSPLAAAASAQPRQSSRCIPTSCCEIRKSRPDCGAGASSTTGDDSRCRSNRRSAR